MPIPFFLAGAAIIAGAAGVVKGGQAISNNSKAKEYIADAQNIYDRAKETMESQRQTTSDDLEKLGTTKLYSWSNDIGNFLEIFRNFKKVDVQKNVNLNDKLKMQIGNIGDIRKMETASLKATEVVGAGVASLGTGALAGIASYGGAMMFASASTGTAIASLSGVAATNATLAWFGGGAIAAGGGGMALGTTVLGGIVAGPVLAVAGFIMAAKSEENLSAAKKTYSEAKLAAEKMDTMSDFMKKVSDISNDYNSFIIGFSEKYQLCLRQVNEMYQRAKRRQSSLLLNKIRLFLGLDFKVDYKKLLLDEQKLLQLSWLMTQVLYAVLTAPLLTQNGDLDDNVYNTLNGAKETAQNLIGVSD